MRAGPRSLPRSILDAGAYLTVRTAAAAVGAAPLDDACRAARALARTYGSLRMNRRRVARAHGNLRAAFPDWSEDQVRHTAIQSYEHLFELGVEFIQAPRILTDDSWPTHLELHDIAPAVRTLVGSGPCVLITGHCGNWEMLGYTVALLGFPMYALYRPLDLPPLDRWVRRVRERRGLAVVDKFGALRRLPALVAGGAPVGFVADQNGGDRGVFVPFFSRLVSTYKSIGLLAMQFNATVVCSAARRIPPEERSVRGGLGYRVEMTDCFGPADWLGHPDPLFYLTARYRRAIEVMVRRAPEQYLWMHRIWRSRPRHERMGKPFPGSLLEKIRLLPWVGEAELGAILEHSRRDAATLAETGQDKLS